MIWQGQTENVIEFTNRERHGEMRADQKESESEVLKWVHNRCPITSNLGYLAQSSRPCPRRQSRTAHACSFPAQSTAVSGNFRCVVGQPFSARVTRRSRYFAAWVS